MSTLSPIEALQKILDYKITGTMQYEAQRMKAIASEALAAHHQQGGKEELELRAKRYAKYAYAKAPEQSQIDAEYVQAVSYYSYIEGAKSTSSPSTATGGWVATAPAIDMETVNKAMDQMNDEQRMSLIGNYCKYCGSNDPGCQCWNDE